MTGKKSVCTVWLLFASFAIVSRLCAGNAPEINRTETCRVHPAHTYQVFVPLHDEKCRNLPLMVVIDPHGNGTLAIDKFKETARKYSVILVASNLIQNNVNDHVGLIEELLADVKSKYPVGSGLYVGGFSGGARMAINYAASHRLSGVIACGALADPEQLVAVQTMVMPIVGTDDFNFIESARFIIRPETIPSNLAILITDASHSWPDHSLLNQAFGFVFLADEHRNTCIDTGKLAALYLAEQNQLQGGKSDVLHSVLFARNLSLSPVFDPSGAYGLKYRKLISDQAFISECDRMNAKLSIELKLREKYLQMVEQKDSNWWKREVSAMNSRIITEPDGQMKMVYRRIKSYLGVACYSMCNHAKAGKDWLTLEKVVAVYRSLEPDNPDMFYFSAVLAHLKKDFPGEKYYLQKAKEKGFQGSLIIK